MEQAQGTSYQGLLPLLPSEEQGRVRDFIEKFYAACKDSLVVFGVSCRWVFVGVLRKFLLGMPAPRTGVCVFLAWLRSPFQWPALHSLDGGERWARHPRGRPGLEFWLLALAGLAPAATDVPGVNQEMELLKMHKIDASLSHYVQYYLFCVFMLLSRLFNYLVQTYVFVF